MAIGIPGGDKVIIPTTDPTFTSGLNYARKIAGGGRIKHSNLFGTAYPSSE